mgnify:CR=1 FL=1
MRIENGAEVAIIQFASAAALTRSGIIGLLGTAATIRQPYVDRLAAEFAADKQLLRFAAGELVGAAEDKLRGKAVDPAIFARAAAGLRAQRGGDGIDTLEGGGGTQMM